jgi:hypothetical protein
VDAAVDARADSEGGITHVRLQGNANFTPVKQAIEMADRGELKNARAVHPRSGRPYLRSNPMAGQQASMSVAMPWLGQRRARLPNDGVVRAG